jgi:predicted XRE-type DNA-binding protein
LVPRIRPRSDITPGSDNVFRDLGFQNPEAELAKAQLALEICTLLRERPMTQVEAARRLGLPQPKVSQLARADVTGFSTDRLLRVLGRLGQDVEIIVTPTPARRPIGRVRVIRRRRPAGSAGA